MNNRYDELLKEIMDMRFIVQVPEMEIKCVVALHRKELTYSQYAALRENCKLRFEALCVGL